MFNYVGQELGVCAREWKCPWKPEVLELEIHIVFGCLTWVLGSELGSSARAGNTFNQRAISLTPV